MQNLANVMKIFWDLSGRNMLYNYFLSQKFIEQVSDCSVDVYVCIGSRGTGRGSKQHSEAA